MGIAEIAIIIALILSIVLHEVAHGYAANWLGDPTARLAGRLSPNPLVHIDPLGSVIVPALLFFSGAGVLFGWAKPVPYNPYNLNNQKWGDAIVAAAGPATNILLALIFGILIRLGGVLDLSPSFLQLSGYIVFINILLALFNLIPFPPLDGSKVIEPFLPYQLKMAYRNLAMFMERYGFVVLIIAVLVLLQFIWPYLFYAVTTVASLVTGLSPIEFINLISSL
jgi:Zn-dependent protease